jgi:hypothetical protein
MKPYFLVCVTICVSLCINHPLQADDSVIETESSRLEIEKEGSKVKVQGEVENPRDAELIRDVYLSKPGISEVDVSEVESKEAGEASVLPPDNTFISDAGQEFAVNLELLLSQALSGATVSATIQNNVVYLDGEVASDLERLLVEEKVAESTDLEVVNRLKIGMGKSLNERASDILDSLTNIFLIIIGLPLVVICVLLYLRNSRSSKKEE